MKTPIPTAATIVVVAALTLGGWAAVHQANLPKSTLIIVDDYSASTESNRQRELGQIAVELEAAQPNTSVVLFRMGSTTEEIFAGLLDETSTETVVKTVKDETTRSDPKKGTNFAVMAEAVANYVDSCKADRIQVQILTDGGDDFKSDPANSRRYHKAADRICSDSRVASITFIGVQTGFREDLRSVWSKAGAKLRLLSASEVPAG